MVAVSNNYTSQAPKAKGGKIEPISNNGKEKKLEKASPVKRVPKVLKKAHHVTHPMLNLHFTEQLEGIIQSYETAKVKQAEEYIKQNLQSLMEKTGCDSQHIELAKEVISQAATGALNTVGDANGTPEHSCGNFYMILFEFLKKNMNQNDEQMIATYDHMNSQSKQLTNIAQQLQVTETQTEQKVKHAYHEAHKHKGLIGLIVGIVLAVVTVVATVATMGAAAPEAVAADAAAESAAEGAAEGAADAGSDAATEASTAIADASSQAGEEGANTTEIANNLGSRLGRLASKMEDEANELESQASKMSKVATNMSTEGSEGSEEAADEGAEQAGSKGAKYASQVGSRAEKAADETKAAATKLRQAATALKNVATKLGQVGGDGGSEADEPMQEAKDVSESNEMSAARGAKTGLKEGLEAAKNAGPGRLARANMWVRANYASNVLKIGGGAAVAGGLALAAGIPTTMSAEKGTADTEVQNDLALQSTISQEESNISDQVQTTLKQDFQAGVQAPTTNIQSDTSIASQTTQQMLRAESIGSV